jgi:hypothetical protein
MAAVADGLLLIMFPLFNLDSRKFYQSRNVMERWQISSRKNPDIIEDNSSIQKFITLMYQLNNRPQRIYRKSFLAVPRHPDENSFVQTSSETKPQWRSRIMVIAHHSTIKFKSIGGSFFSVNKILPVFSIS